MQVRQLAGAAAVAPLCGQHDEVEGVDRFDLAPGFASAARCVDRVDLFDHHTFVTRIEHRLGERFTLARIGGDNPVHHISSCYLVEVSESLV